MTNLIYIIGLIVVVFALAIMAKNILRMKKACAICIAISSTWIILLALYLTDFFSNSMIIGILMGQSIVGVYYFLEKRLKNEMKMFSLPFILTLTVAAYTILTEDFSLSATSILSGLWLATYLMHLYRKSSRFGHFIKKIVECCGEW